MATYYVSLSTNTPAGSNSNPGTIAAPWQRISYAVSQLSAGDTLYIRGGTYTNTADRIDSQDYTVPTGTNATTGAISIVGYPGETVVIKPPNGKSAIRFATHTVNYYHVTDIDSDMSLQTTPATGPNGHYVSENSSYHIFDRCDIYNNSSVGAGANTTTVAGGSGTGNAHHNIWRNCNVYGNGQGWGVNQGYGFYLDSTDNIIENCNIYSNGGYGIHIYNFSASAHRNIVRNNLVYGNGTDGGTNFGILYAEGSDGLVYNNVVYGNRGGIQVYTGSSNIGVYNNTVVGNTVYSGIELQYYGGAPIINNNIVYSNAADIVDYGGTATIGPHNWKTSDGNPLFTAPGSHDYTLQSGSPVINAGSDLSATFTTDFNGTARSTFDLGAYEYATGTSSHVYYVSLSTNSPAGSNSNSGAIGAPWQRISYAMAHLSAGDTLYIRGGTYTHAQDVIDSELFTVPSGNSLDWGTTYTGAIKVYGYPGETVLIKPPNGSAAIRLRSGIPHHLVFQDFDLDGSLQADPAVDGGGFIISNALELVYAANLVSYVRFQGMDIGHAVQFTTSGAGGPYDAYLSLVDCTIHDAGEATGDSGNGPGINTGSAVLNWSDHNTITDCRVFDNQGTGITLYGSNNSVTDCLIHDNGSGGGTTQGITIGSTEYGVANPGATSDDNLIANNVIYRNGDGIRVYTDSDGTIVANNTLSDNADDGIATQFYIAATVQNNIVVDSGGTDIVDYGSGTLTANHNFVTSDGDPDFAAPGSDDYSLLGTSPCINTGTTVAAVTTDIAGVTRPVGGTYDKGAYEYNSTNVTVAITGVSAAGTLGMVTAAGGSVLSTAITPTVWLYLGDWMNVSEDVAMSEGFTHRFGVDGDSPMDVVAGSGELTLTLRNAAVNSGKAEGYYSPSHASVRPGWTYGVGVAVVYYYGGFPYRSWTGKIAEIDPDPDPKGPRHVRVVAYDYAHDLVDAEVKNITPQVNQGEPTLVGAVLAAVPTEAQPVGGLDYSLSDEYDTFPLAFDKLGTSTKAATAIADVARSSLGLFYVDQSGTAVYKTRHALLSAETSATLTDADICGFSAATSRQGSYNVVRVSLHPKRTASSIVLWESAADSPRRDDSAADVLPRS